MSEKKIAKIECKRCGRTIIRKGRAQRYCDECRAVLKLERRQQYKPKPHVIANPEGPITCQQLKVGIVTDEIQRAHDRKLANKLSVKLESKIYVPGSEEFNKIAEEIYKLERQRNVY